MKARCLIEVQFPDAGAASLAIKALEHEGDVGGRSKTNLSSKGKLLLLEIEAGDIVALRATSNAFMRAIAVFEGIEKS